MNTQQILEFCREQQAKRESEYAALARLEALAGKLLDDREHATNFAVAVARKMADN